MPKIQVQESDALVGIDVQNDFCPGGNLAVTDGHAVVPVFNRLSSTLAWLLYVLSQDWHPSDHGSFASTNNAAVFSEGELDGLPQTFWPDHCVQGTSGAEFHPDLDLGKVSYIQQKGMKQKRDSYSAFNDNGGEDTGFAGYLRSRGVKRIFVGGLATDYCVEATAKDGRKAGFEVYVITDACRGIGDSEAAFKRMEDAGCVLCTSADLLAAA